MFSSNQELVITGSLEQLEQALRFAMAYSGQAEHLTPAEQKRGCKVVYQIAGNMYAIGWGFENVPEHWKEWDFDFDYDIVSRVIQQFIEKKKDTVDNAYREFDGTSRIGFKMHNIDDYNVWEEDGKLKNCFYGIVAFEPYWNFYSK